LEGFVMSKFRKLLGSGLAAALLATSASPALARGGYHDDWGRSGGYHGGGWEHGYRYRRGPDFGDALLGAIIVGGVAAIASEAIRSASERDRRRDHGWRDRDYRPLGSEDAAASECADAVERQMGADARVERIRDVRTEGSVWRVEGDVSDRRDGSRSFYCGVRDGRIDYVQVGGRNIWR
jgi:hypothetical protein